MADVTITDQGTLVQIQLNSEAAMAFVQSNVHLESWQWSDRAFVVELRYASRLIEGMQEERLEVTEVRRPPAKRVD